ncbi:hypothetical protein [Mameliella alba]|uniref:hypothetical protein n=1 Tax=Mameliella alba TaxID=561184 RepID=UPI000B531E87|nr:hypothetical protein [Mameliella alba]OWV44241.1 hypothetical protein CDZ95_06025 [Mameliella alba]
MTDTSREAVEALAETADQCELQFSDPVAATLRALLDRAEAAEAEVERLREALAWYHGNVSWCNNFGPEGAEARDRLAKDGGARAEAALQEKPDE